MRGIYVILTYNGGKMPIGAIDSILKHDGSDTEIIVVDNGSTHNYTDYLSKELKKYGFVHIGEDDFRFRWGDVEKQIKQPVRVLFSLNKNRLYSGGMRWGSKLAYRLGYDFAILSNDDIELMGEVLKPMSSVFEMRKDVGIINSLILVGTEKNKFDFERCTGMDVRCKRVFYLLLGHKISYKLCCSKKRKMAESFGQCEQILFNNGSFFGIRLLPFRKMGFLRYRMFLGGEELEIADGFLGLGYKSVYCPDIGPVWHYQSITIGRDRGRYLLGDFEYVSRRYSPQGHSPILSFLLVIYMYRMGMTPKAISELLERYGWGEQLVVGMRNILERLIRMK